jgi:hypothetical protein
MRSVSKSNACLSAGELVNLAADSNPGVALAAEPCVDTYCRGDHADNLPAQVWDNLPQHFILDTHLPRILEGLDPDLPPGVVEPTNGVVFMPDVSFSHVGMPYFCNDCQVCAHTLC